MGCTHHHLNTTISLCRTARPPSWLLAGEFGMGTHDAANRSSTTMRELVMVIAMVTRAVPFHVLINIFHLSASSFFFFASLATSIPRRHDHEINDLQNKYHVYHVHVATSS